MLKRKAIPRYIHSNIVLVLPYRRAVVLGRILLPTL